MEFPADAVRVEVAELSTFLLTIEILILTAAISAAFSVFFAYLLEHHPLGRRFAGILTTLPEWIAKPLGECVYCSGTWHYLFIGFFLIKIPFLLCCVGFGVNYLAIHLFLILHRKNP